MNDPKGGVAKVTCPTFEAMGQIPAFHRTYFLLGKNIGINIRSRNFTKKELLHKIMDLIRIKKINKLKTDKTTG